MNALKINVNTISELLLYLYIACIFCPYIVAYYFLIPCIIGLLFCLSTAKAFLRLGDRLAVSLALFLFVSIFYRLIGYSTADIGNYAYRFLFFVSAWGGIFAWYYLDEKARNRIFVVLLIVLTANLIDNFIIHIQNPIIYATLKGTEYFESTWGKSNVGLTNWVYCIALLALFLYLLLIKNDKPFVWRTKRVIAFIIMIASFVFVFVFGGSGTILLSIILTFFLFTIVQNENLKNRTLVSILLGILLVVVFYGPFIDEIIEFVRDISGDKVATRISVIKNIGYGYESVKGNEYLLRFYYIEQDFATFLRNPLTMLFGNGYHSYISNVATEIIQLNGAGNHSGYCDILARYGLLGTSILISILAKTRRFILGNTGDYKKKRLVNAIFIVLCLNNIFNNIISFDILFLIYFVLPFYTYEGEESAYEFA